MIVIDFVVIKATSHFEHLRPSPWVEGEAHLVRRLRHLGGGGGGGTLLWFGGWGRGIDDEDHPGVSHPIPTPMALQIGKDSHLDVTL